MVRLSELELEARGPTSEPVAELDSGFRVWVWVLLVCGFLGLGFEDTQAKAKPNALNPKL